MKRATRRLYTLTLYRLLLLGHQDGTCTQEAHIFYEELVVEVVGEAKELVVVVVVERD